ncbi:MAG TPA: M18 family aminopeptidase [Rhodocyclaceae bacterium]|nr:M18 family aminopeptidase [Rhodocyclaceae bacterium]
MSTPVSTSIAPTVRQLAEDLLAFIDASPSPWHVVANTVSRLATQGFIELNENERWKLQRGGRYFVRRGGASIIAFVVGSGDLAQTGLRLIGAHTDSPGLRLKPKAAHAADGMVRLGVEIYGGPILATFTDRDLSLAGRVNVRSPRGYEIRLLQFKRPLVRLPNLAIHMNRDVNETGLKLHKQNELPLLFAMAEENIDSDTKFRTVLAEHLAVEANDILTWDICTYDTQPGSFWGPELEFIADSQLDNLASCHAALTALLVGDAPDTTNMVAFFDHEEVGSESTTGANGSFMSDVIARLSQNLGLDAEDQRRTLANSFFISADMAHAWHPNFPAAYEPCHRVLVNHGPVIKTNANQRYATGADTAARFMQLCEQAGVPVQNYSHRTDLGCGSTIGPIVAARLGIPTVDVGNPMWAMHSVRESAGVLDHGYMIAALAQAFA